MRSTKRKRKENQANKDKDFFNSASVGLRIRTRRTKTGSRLPPPVMVHGIAAITKTRERAAAKSLPSLVLQPYTLTLALWRLRGTNQRLPLILALTVCSLTRISLLRKLVLVREVSQRRRNRQLTL
jgi:hypothetical protein